MTTKRPLNSENHATYGWGRYAALVGALILSSSAPAGAEGPAAQSSGRLGGIYKVTSSTDPMFPATRTQEYFLDFGRGIQAEKLAGSVAVSQRQNPNVKVRIMVWQYFPERGMIVIGNSTAEGSRDAVVRGVWRMRDTASGVVFERGTYQVVLHRADPKDY